MNKQRQYPSRKEIIKILDYNGDNGLFYWKHRPREMFTSDRSFGTWNTKYAGKLAGFVNSVGLPMIQIGKTSYKQSRIAYAYVNGDIDNGDVDHINRDVKDNRICNLRYVTHSENGRNRRVFKNNKTGITGVGFHKNLRQWQSHIKINKKSIHLGYYDVFRDAVVARKLAEEKYGFTLLNKNSSANQFLGG